MYNVSENYLNTIRNKVRSDSISGSVTLSDGTVIEISDANIVRDSVRITRDICGASYRIGTFCLACLQITLIDPEVTVRDYGGAVIELTYTLGDGEGGSVGDVPLGRYISDGTAAKRVKNKVTLTAYDNGLLFDVAPSEAIRAMTAAPYSLISAACAQCGVTLATASAKIAAMPNSGVSFSPKSAQIQTCRDLIMWCAEVLCAYAVINRGGELEIIPAKYMVDSDDPTDIVIDRYLTAEERKSISVTDTRAYIKYLTGYSDGKVKNYTSTHNDADIQAFPAAYETRSNPLLSGKSESECDAVNRSFLEYIDAFKQRGVSAEIYGDPAIDVGDTIRFSGGDIDQRRSIVGLVTGIVWRYHGYCTLTCKAAVCCYDPPEASSSGGGSPQSDSAARLSGTKPQTEKRIDAIEVKEYAAGNNITFRQGTGANAGKTFIDAAGGGSGGSSGGGITTWHENFGSAATTVINSAEYKNERTVTVPWTRNQRTLKGFIVHGYIDADDLIARKQLLEFSKMGFEGAESEYMTDYMKYPLQLTEITGYNSANRAIYERLVYWGVSYSVMYTDSITFRVVDRQYGLNRSSEWSIDLVYG